MSDDLPSPACGDSAPFASTLQLGVIPSATGLRTTDAQFDPLCDVGDGTMADAAPHREVLHPQPTRVVAPSSPPDECEAILQSALPRPVLCAVNESRPGSEANLTGSLLNVLPKPPSDILFECGQPSFVTESCPLNDLALPSPPIVKPGRDLRLPSFNLLGIAAPHPDHIYQGDTSFFNNGAGPLSKPDDPLHFNSPSRDLTWLPLRSHSPSELPRVTPSGRARRRSFQQVINTVTPPEDGSVSSWATVKHPASYPVESPDTDTDSRRPVRSPVLIDPAMPVSLIRQESFRRETDSSQHGFVESVLDLLAKRAGHSDGADSALTIMSHALPCPSADGHVFHTLIQGIQSLYSSVVWVNVIHAVPGRFNIAELPSSPPSTPGPAIGGDDYFAVTTYDSAVQVTDYQTEATLVPAARGPQPVVRPCSIDISVVERYVPPTSRLEIEGLFRGTGRSILLDRLSEVSADDGYLLFVYPTHKGGRTFKDQYLGPILDPLLRSMVVVHGLSAEISTSLGQTISVDGLYTYDELHSNLIDLCARLSRPMSAHSKRPSLGRFSSRQNVRSSGEGSSTAAEPSGSAERHILHQVEFAEKREVHISRKAWAADWWTKQEKTRVRETLARYWTHGHRPQTVETSHAPLVAEILEGVAQRQYPRGAEPTVGIEVGVFMVRKTLVEAAPREASPPPTEAKRSAIVVPQVADDSPED